MPVALRIERHLNVCPGISIVDMVARVAPLSYVAIISCIEIERQGFDAATPRTEAVGGEVEREAVVGSVLKTSQIILKRFESACTNLCVVVVGTVTGISLVASEGVVVGCTRVEPVPSVSSVIVELVVLGVADFLQASALVFPCRAIPAIHVVVGSVVDQLALKGGNALVGTAHAVAAAGRDGAVTVGIDRACKAVFQSALAITGNYGHEVHHEGATLVNLCTVELHICGLIVVALSVVLAHGKEGEEILIVVVVGPTGPSLRCNRCTVNIDIRLASCSVQVEHRLHTDKRSTVGSNIIFIAKLCMNFVVADSLEIEGIGPAAVVFTRTKNATTPTTVGRSNLHSGEDTGVGLRTIVGDEEVGFGGVGDVLHFGRLRCREVNDFVYAVHLVLTHTVVLVNLAIGFAEHGSIAASVGSKVVNDGQILR